MIHNGSQGTEWLLAWQELPQGTGDPSLPLHLSHTIAADGHLHRVVPAAAPPAHSVLKACLLKPLPKIFN